MLSLPPASLAAAISRCTTAQGSPGVLLSNSKDLSGREQVTQAIAAKKKSAIGFERQLSQLDEVVIVRMVLFGTYVPVDFIAAGMLHRFEFIEPAAIFAISYR